MITENIPTLKIHKLTQEQYDRELAAGNIDETALYLTPDERASSISVVKREILISSDENYTSIPWTVTTWSDGYCECETVCKCITVSGNNSMVHLPRVPVNLSLVEVSEGDGYVQVQMHAIGGPDNSGIEYGWVNCESAGRAFLTQELSNNFIIVSIKASGYIVD